MQKEVNLMIALAGIELLKEPTKRNLSTLLGCHPKTLNSYLAELKKKYGIEFILTLEGAISTANMHVSVGSWGQINRIPLLQTYEPLVRVNAAPDTLKAESPVPADAPKGSPIFKTASDSQEDQSA